MKKFISVTALSILGFVPLFVTPTFAMTTPPPVVHYNQAVASWKPVAGANCYNIYYGWVSRKNKLAWNYSVPCVPNTMWQYTIKNLKQGRFYEYMVAALNNSGAEYSWTSITPLSKVTPMR